MSTPEYQHAYYLAHRERIIEQVTAWKAAHPDKVREYNARAIAKPEAKRKRLASSRALRAAHPERGPEYARRWRERNPEKVAEQRARAKARGYADATRRWRYGLSPEDYAAMQTAQAGVCAICGFVPRVFHVDHDHQTGQIRKLLCYRCNTALGALRDDPAIALSAHIYLLSAAS